MNSNNRAELDPVPLFQYVDDDDVRRLPPTSHVNDNLPVIINNGNQEICNEFENEFYKEIEDFIDNTEEKGIHASISGHKYYMARIDINYFFENEDVRLCTYGTSSSDMRSHKLFRHSNGKMYVVHHAYGELSDWFPLTGCEVSRYFNDGSYENTTTNVNDMHPKTKAFVENS
jgi:hypothetical protein